MRTHRHNRTTTLVTGRGNGIPVGAVGPAPLPEGKTRCDICYHVVSVTKSGMRRSHKIRGRECPGSGMRA